MIVRFTADFGMGGMVWARAAKPATAVPAIPATTLRRVGWNFILHSSRMGVRGRSSARGRGCGRLTARRAAAEAGRAAQAGLHVYVFAFSAGLVAAAGDRDVADAGMARHRLLDDVDAETRSVGHVIVAL